MIDKKLKKELREYVKERMENILQKDNLEHVQQKRDDILKVFQDTFWDELAFEDVEFMIKELAPLMIYYEKNPKRMLQVDAPDIVLKIEEFKKEAFTPLALKASTWSFIKAISGDTTTVSFSLITAGN